MKKFLITIVAALLVAPASSFAQDTLDQLLNEVQRAAQQERQINQEREARFQRERNNQQQLLAEARQELQRQENRADQLRAEYDENEINLAELETTLDERLGNLGELFGVVRQSAGDLATTLEQSLISAQYPGRHEFLSDLGRREELPTGQELRQMWARMVEHIVEQGKVVSFNADVVDAEGETITDAPVVRVGVFNAVSDGDFLTWQPDIGNNGSLVELARQPAGRFQSMADELQSTPPGEITPMAVDFTSGAILSQVVQSKTPIERVQEDGGPVGYVILGVGAFGLLLCFWKLFSLMAASSRIKSQMKKDSPDKNNALGRVMAVYADNPEADIETLELKLDEAILRETAPLESGLSFIKVLYVVAPLLGLLGTVIGMIVTFQQITLFGTGDPRMMAGGISTALVTTVLGLVVAIPLTLFHSFLQPKARSLIQILEEQAAGIIARIAEKRDVRSS